MVLIIFMEMGYFLAPVHFLAENIRRFENFGHEAIYKDELQEKVVDLKQNPKNLARIFAT